MGGEAWLPRALCCSRRGAGAGAVGSGPGGCPLLGPWSGLNPGLWSQAVVPLLFGKWNLGQVLSPPPASTSSPLVTWVWPAVVPDLGEFAHSFPCLGTLPAITGGGRFRWPGGAPGQVCCRPTVHTTGPSQGGHPAPEVRGTELEKVVLGGRRRSPCCAALQTPAVCPR